MEATSVIEHLKEINKEIKMNCYYLRIHFQIFGWDKIKNTNNWMFLIYKDFKKYTLIEKERDLLNRSYIINKIMCLLLVIDKKAS
jgi:hypothetical protein